ncbi:nuclear transport factor 2 family protein [Rudaeicoccus suwonensis]|uniref:SnoaL-like protein n=1 Tax=Rudaeicoccus suwonensis TaxID=657409 RepID=A0A561E9M0_9MICO|nr:nuclear transport factor 2 family protein [Rudaeicoccus suwonensis]TWE12318.1 SnoaL-like protein [Rudaeicoccus suwonensis]
MDQDTTSHEALPKAVRRWYDIAAAKDASQLPGILADGVVFRSPAVHTPQEGRALTTAYLSAALAVLGPSLRYHRNWISDTSAVLEFTAELDGLQVHGIDMIAWDEHDRLVEFTVMVRPMKGLHRLVELMGAQLQSGH